MLNGEPIFTDDEIARLRDAVKALGHLVDDSQPDLRIERGQVLFDYLLNGAMERLISEGTLHEKGFRDQFRSELDAILTRLFKEELGVVLSDREYQGNSGVSK